MDKICVCGKVNCEMYGLCHCGCGKPTNKTPATTYCAGRRLKKGEPRKFRAECCRKKINRSHQKVHFNRTQV